MEVSEGLSSGGVTVVGSDAPSDYHMVHRTAENLSQLTGTTPPEIPSAPPSTAAGEAPGVRKKRGRPRKYGPDGSFTVTLSPKPISTAAPPPHAAAPVIDFTAEKRGKVKPVKTHHPRVDLDASGDWVSCSVGANFTPHVITVNAGEDVTMKIISFSQQGPRAICILSATGVISSVTLRQPDSSGGTLTYEGRFEILSLTGSFMPSETGGIRNRSGGMSVSFVSPDGRIVGGGVAGLLVAAGPVQVVVGSFLAGNQVEQKAKKHKPETVIAAVPISSNTEIEDNHHSSVKPIVSPAPSFRADNWTQFPSDSRNKPTDINVTLPA